MNDSKRRFFSGDSLQQALVQAANHYNLPPEEIAYRSLEKRHGFLKVRRKAVIEVNPDAPKRERATAPAPAPPSPPARPAAPPAESLPVELPQGPARPDAAEAGERFERRPESRPEPRRREEPRRRTAPPRYSRETAPDLPRPDLARPDLAREATPQSPSEPGLVALPDTPRRPTERYPGGLGPHRRGGHEGRGASAAYCRAGSGAARSPGRRPPRGGSFRSRR